MVLAESWMNYPNIVFVSYRVFLLYIKNVTLNFTFEFLVTFFAMSPLMSHGNFLISQFIPSLTSCPLKNEETEISSVNYIYCIIHVPFQP